MGTNISDAPSGAAATAPSRAHAKLPASATKKSLQLRGGAPAQPPTTSTSTESPPTPPSTVTEAFKPACATNICAMLRSCACSPTRSAPAGCMLPTCSRQSEVETRHSSSFSRAEEGRPMMESTSPCSHSPQPEASPR